MVHQVELAHGVQLPEQDKERILDGKADTPLWCFSHREEEEEEEAEAKEGEEAEAKDRGNSHNFPRRRILLRKLPPRGIFCLMTEALLVYKRNRRSPLLVRW